MNSSSSRESSQPSRWPLAAIVVGAIVVRLGLMVGGMGRLDDPDRYLVLARSIVEGQGFAINDRPTAYRPPLYPILLAPLVASLDRSSLPWGVGGLHLLLGIGTVLFIYATARRFELSAARGWIAAGIVAFDPVLIGQSRVVMTETLAAFLVSATIAGLTIRGVSGAALAGLGLGLATLCRPSFLPPTLVIVLAASIFGPGGWKVRVGRSGILLLMFALMMLPWVVRNHAIFGEPVWTTTHGGYTLILANNEAYYADVLDGPAGAVWSGVRQDEWMAKIARETEGISEPRADRYFQSEGVRIFLARPADFARASLERFKRFWGVAPSGSIYPRWLRMITTAWTVPLWIALAAGLCRKDWWRWPGVVGPSILLALTLVHLVFWTDMRMRAPLVPVIALIAASAGLGRSQSRENPTSP